MAKPKLQRVAAPAPDDDVHTPRAMFGLSEHSLKVADVDVDAIAPNPHQPRRHFDEFALQALADSIASHGLQQPIVVRREGGRYVLVAGERRLRAHRLLGRTQISAVISTASSDGRGAELALVENVQRSNLNAVELASGIKALMEQQGLTQEDAGRVAGLARTTTSRLLGVLRLPEGILAEYPAHAETVSQSMLVELSEVEDGEELRLLWDRAKTGLLRRDDVRGATQQLRQRLARSPAGQGSRELLAVGKTLANFRKGILTLKATTLEDAHRDELRKLRAEINTLLGES